MITAISEDPMSFKVRGSCIFFSVGMLDGLSSLLPLWKKCFRLTMLELLLLRAGQFGQFIFMELLIVRSL